MRRAPTPTGTAAPSGAPCVIAVAGNNDAPIATPACGFCQHKSAEQNKNVNEHDRVLLKCSLVRPHIDSTLMADASLYY